MAGVAVAILLAAGGLVAYGVDGALGLTYARRPATTQCRIDA